MTLQSCLRSGCTGTLEDGYCDTCGMAAVPSAKSPPVDLSPHQGNLSASIQSSRLQSASHSASHSASISRGTVGSGTTGSAVSKGSTPFTGRSRGTRRSSSTSRRSTRKQLGAGLISLPDMPSTDPEKAILVNPQVPEHKRFCAKCENPLKRERGFCSKCGQKYSFVPSLQPGDVVAEQYEVKGAIAYGGLGWIYLAQDRILSRYVVLKGLLNTEDASSAAVALAERQFLASVKHANIVGIYNFVTHGGEGFIVMEYVGGKTLKDLRKESGTLPVAEAIAYIHRTLSAFSYLHAQGLVYCDFKPDNVMLEDGDIKLIDMGGVRRIDDPDGDIYGTVGYSAPEAGEGPTVVSDLFTIGRTLAVLVASIPGFGKAHRHTLPGPDEVALFDQQDSLYRFLLKATALDPNERFQSADEMADQLLGVLREVVALQTQTPRPAASSHFEGDRLAQLPEDHLTDLTYAYEMVPLPLLDPQDPAISAVQSAIAIADDKTCIQRLEALAQKSPSAGLHLACRWMKLRDYGKAEQMLEEVRQQNPWEWRVPWHLGRLLLAQGQPALAAEQFEQVYFDLPGEVAPKLALALAAEQAGEFPLAARRYTQVMQTDPSYVTALFGLARTQQAMGNRGLAVTTLEQVPADSSLFVRSRLEIARILSDRSDRIPTGPELAQAGAVVDRLTLDAVDRHQIFRRILTTALDLVATNKLAAVTSGAPPGNLTLLGKSFSETHLRQNLETVLRSMAHLSTGEEKIHLVDEANRIRPRTLI